MQSEIQAVGLFLEQVPPRQTLIGSLAQTTHLNATTQQVLGLSWAERRTFLQELWTFNAERQPSEMVTSESGLYEVAKTAGFLRRFNQLPCTLACRHRRADLIEKSGDKNRKILVLGDDDLLSVELARRGFTAVSVADCDTRLLGRIGRETASLPNPPRLIEADFRVGLDDQIKADVVVLDPPNNLAAALTFFRLAVASVRFNPDAVVYLMINPKVFGGNFEIIKRYAATCGFKVDQHHPGFNAYPLGAIDSLLLRSAWRGLIRKKSPASRRGQGLLFSSDCFAFKRQS